MLSDDETTALVQRSKQGERAAFEAPVRAYLRAAYLVALAQVGRPTDAEDVARDALLIAFASKGVVSPYLLPERKT